MKNKSLILIPFSLLALSSCGGNPAPSASSSSSQTESSSSSSSSSSSFVPPTPSKPANPIPTAEQPLREINDNYRTMYQIFPYSFADSDQDGIGDLFGIMEKLDYIHDLNYTGIWMTPICPSPSYHKYDVTDYYDIDEKFGDLMTFDMLVSSAHDLDMTVVFDLVINHASSQHEWFKECSRAHINNDTTNPYYDYFVIEEGSPKKGWYRLPGSSNLIYEAQFYDGMPDFNLQSVLDNPNGKLASEFKDIIKFWLVDHEVDGFRLDAVTSYFTGDANKNTQFLTWLNEACREVKEDVYIVGEGSWGANSKENKQYQESGCDSFFNFANYNLNYANGIPNILTENNATRLVKAMQASWDTAANGIPANFIGNHDVGRLGNAVGGRSSVDKLKFAHSLLGILPGAIYNYYGDEVGHLVPTSKKGDPDIRLHVEWGDEFVTNDPPGVSNYNKDTTYPYGTVASQLADEGSILNHVKKINLLRKQFPEIARGTTELLDEFVYPGSEVKIAAISKKTTESEIAIVINPSMDYYFDYDLSKLEGYTPVAEVAIKGNSTYHDNILQLVPGAIVVLKK